MGTREPSMNMLKTCDDWHSHSLSYSECNYVVCEWAT